MKGIILYLRNVICLIIYYVFVDGFGFIWYCKCKYVCVIDVRLSIM